MNPSELVQYQPKLLTGEIRLDKKHRRLGRILTPTWEDDVDRFLAPKHLPPPPAKGQEMLEAQPEKTTNITKHRILQRAKRKN